MRVARGHYVDGGKSAVMVVARFPAVALVQYAAQFVRGVVN